MARPSVTFVVLAMLGLGAVPCRAGGGGSSARFSIAVGGGSGSMSVGNKSRGTFAPNLAARLAFGKGGWLSLGAEVQPARVPNPVGDEAFVATNLLLGAAVGSRFRVRVLAGAQFRQWSGPRRSEASDVGPLIGADVGYDVRLNDRLTLTPELLWRYSIVEVEGNCRSGYTGAQVALAWGGRRP